MTGRTHPRIRRGTRGLPAVATAVSLLAACGNDGGDGAAPAATAAAQPRLISGDGYAVRMPGTPERSRQESEVDGGKLSVEIYLYDTPTEAYTFTRVLYPDAAPPPDLEQTLRGSAQSAGGALDASSTFEYTGHDAAEGSIVNARANGQPVIIFSRYVAGEHVLFGMVYLAKGVLPDEPPPAFLAFANSLQFS